MQCRIPSWNPPSPPSKLPLPFGPLTTAPTSIGGLPSRVPERLATWCCMQSGNVCPTPTIAVTPQGSPPSSQVRCEAREALEAVAVGEPRRRAPTVAIRPKVWEFASNSSTGSAAPNGS